MAAEDVRDLQRWPCHGRGLTLLADLLQKRHRDLADRAFDGGDPSRSHAGITGRRIELVMAKHRLNQTDIQALLEKMGGKRVPERMQRHWLLDAGGFSCLVEQTRELARSERLGAPPAGKQPALL